MRLILNSAMPIILIISFAGIVRGQGMKMGEVIIVSNSPKSKDIQAAAFQTWFTTNIAPVWNKKNSGASMNLFLADRGDRKDEYLLVCSATRVSDRKALGDGSPFTEKSLGLTTTESSNSRNFLRDPESYTEYHLLGADKFKSLPIAGILGIHFIKVKPERSGEFEKFVIEKLHPRVSQLLPDMQMLYYKAVAGENSGSYITIFTIASPASRDKYWPAGAPETEALKQAFRPLNTLALELAPYLVEGSFLAPESGGAAAYFESRQWTDFIHQDFLK